MTFLNSGALILIILVVPTFTIFFYWRYAVKQKLLAELGESHLITALTPPMDRWRRWIKSSLWLIAVVSTIIALARPVWGIEIDTVETQGLSIYFVLDVSRSMDAEDISPSRLERAKLDLKEIFRSMNGNSLGLILFARNAFVLFPLTTDSTSLPEFVNSISTESVSGQGSNIASGLRLALDSFNQTIQNRQIIVLLSDGEALEGDTITMVDETSNHDTAIFTIGYGGFEGAPIPLRDQNGNVMNYKTDLQGNLILSKLDDQSLKTLAEMSGGAYYRADAQGSEILSLIRDLQGIEASMLGSVTQSRGKEHSDIFAALALIALTAEILFPTAQKRVA